MSTHTLPAPSVPLAYIAEITTADIKRLRSLVRTTRTVYRKDGVHLIPTPQRLKTQLVAGRHMVSQEALDDALKAGVLKLK